MSVSVDDLRGALVELGASLNCSVMTNAVISTMTASSC